MNPHLRSIAIKAVDLWMAVVPRRRPAHSSLRDCRIVSHRGEHGDTAVAENTMRAFKIARDAGVWGIETDIRWTADLVPVIIHDPDTRRVFGKDLTVAEIDFDELRASVPEVPSLAELILEFGGRTHIMLELKAERFPELERQKQILRDHLKSLEPIADYHILALDPDLFETFDIEPRKCCLPVAEENLRTLSELTVASPYGGLTGHYLLMDEDIRRRHERARQKTGTGFIRSRNCLYRELNRGIEWIFSNDAVKLQKAIDRELER